MDPVFVPILAFFFLVLSVQQYNKLQSHISKVGISIFLFFILSKKYDLVSKYQVREADSINNTTILGLKSGQLTNFLKKWHCVWNSLEEITHKAHTLSFKIKCWHIFEKLMILSFSSFHTSADCRGSSFYEQIHECDWIEIFNDNCLCSFVYAGDLCCMSLFTDKTNLIFFLRSYNYTLLLYFYIESLLFLDI